MRQLDLKKDGYWLDVPLMDNDHQKMAEAYNAVVRALNQKMDQRELSLLVGRVYQETRGHFTREEAYMVQCRYEEMESHRIEHSKLLLLLGDYVQKLVTEEATVEAESVSFVSDWLTRHIRTTDGRLAVFIKNLPPENA